MESSMTTYSVLDSCFFCLDQILTVKLEPDTEITPPSQNHSIQYLSRYLNLDMGKMFQDESITDLTDDVESSKLKVLLCEVCAPLADKFSKLYRELKRVEMEVGSCLNCIHSKLLFADDVGVVGRMAQLHGSTDDSKGLESTEILTQLRTEIIQKCSELLNAEGPKVKIKHPKGKKSTRKRKVHRRKSKKLLPTKILQPKLEPDEREIKLEYIDVSLPPHQLSDEDQSREAVALEDECEEKKMDEDVTESTSPDIKATQNKVVKRKWFINPETGKHKCRLCSREFNCASSFRVHYTRAHPSFQVRFPCKLCGKIFKQRDNYDRHHISVHLGLKFECQVCHKSFTQLGNLRLHERMTGCGTDAKTSTVPSSRHVCNLCEKTFARKSYLKIHMNGVHIGSRKYGCDICGKTYKTRSHLTIHRERLHEPKPSKPASTTSLEKFKCHLCEKEFAYNGSLQYHLKTSHLNLRDHLCPQCGKGFPRECELKRHVKHKHSELRENLCDLCGKKFKQKAHLDTHRRKVHEEGK